jgi:hypothetical protein
MLRESKVLDNYRLFGTVVNSLLWAEIGLSMDRDLKAQ